MMGIRFGGIPICAYFDVGSIPIFRPARISPLRQTEAKMPEALYRARAVEGGHSLLRPVARTPSTRTRACDAGMIHCDSSK